MKQGVVKVLSWGIRGEVFESEGRGVFFQEPDEEVSVLFLSEEVTKGGEAVQILVALCQNMAA